MLKEKYLAFEKTVSKTLQKHSYLLLRISMGIVYLWYGLLKIVDMSPVEELVYRATHWIGVKEFVTFLGYWEVVIGLCLLIKKFNRLGLLLLFLQFPGTFLPLFLNPEDCFTMIPFGLTLEGQYVFKNLILVSVGLTLIGSLHKKDHSL